MAHVLGLQQPIRRLAAAASAAAARDKPKKWTSVVGLEIHAQIQSASKLFSASRATFGAPVNTCVSPFDASLPGTLPALNRRCVESAVRTALALDARVHGRSAFDRKHYFYADLPTGYQITQQRAPLATGGAVECHVFVPGVTKRPYAKRVRLTQLQLEQDSGKSLHDAAEGKSLVDLNRAGMPLMELVFEPDLSTGEEAAALVKELSLILTRLGTCSCRMEEGALRVDANISIHDAAAGEPLGTRTEVKNIGSVRGVADAVTYEIWRQCAVRDTGGQVHNETRAWDAAARCTVAMRDKEVQQDYRFMPEPNLPPLVVRVEGDENAGNEELISVEALRATLPELPAETRRKLGEEFGLGADVAAILLNEPTLLAYFYEILRLQPDAPTKLITNILCNEFLSLCHRQRCDTDASGIRAADLGELIAMLRDETLNLMLARLVLEQMLVQPDVPPRQLAAANGWQQISDPQRIAELCAAVRAANPKMVASYAKGKTKALFAMAGEIVRQTEQRANMALVVAELERQLKQK